VKRALGGTLYMVAGGLIGIATAIVSVDYLGSSPLTPGSNWRSFGVAADSPAAFYANAHYLLGGRLPPAPGQQQEMTASRDSDGNLLSAGCNYLVTGDEWNHVWWSIATASEAGVMPRVETMLTGDSVVYEADGSLRITVSAGPATGNWIRPPSARNFILIFTAAGESGLSRQEPLPDLTVSKGDCA
jgi:hypothetical protein